MPTLVRPDTTDDFLLRPDPAAAAPRLLVVVHTAPSFADSRAGIRRSWGHPGYQRLHSAAVVFLVGTSGSPAVAEAVREEARAFGDILQADFVDHYNNLTLKSVYTLKYLVTNKWEVMNWAITTTLL